jgi:beta-glucanase (GH16 family)
VTTPTIAAVVLALGAGLVTVAASSEYEKDPRSSPARTPAKWKRVFVEDFEHGLDRSRWGAYSGQPGGDPGGWWDPSHVRVEDGVLNLETYRDPSFGNRWVSGGVSSSHGLKQRYGKYLVRFRMDRGKGVAGVLLLWPVADVWPPEVDFAETGGVSEERDEMSATLHYGKDNHQLQRTVRADFTRWHTMGVEWTPGRLVYTLDGRPWTSVRSGHVPRIPMEMDIQAQAGTCGDRYAPCPDETTPARVSLQVDRVVAYRYVGGTR